ncbi:FAR1 DNA binding domain protein [Raphanus sativus]|nr:FAR1 DNA binding domain protein [Raphanus sativus]
MTFHSVNLKKNMKQPTKEDQVESEGVDVLEAYNENEKKDELCIGMEFSSDEAAYIAYCKYAGNHGFNVRKQRRTKKKKEDDKAVRILYVCSKEGVRKESTVKRSFSRPITRCDCKAHMGCYLQSSGSYKIVSFDPNHNHDLVRTPMKHWLKGNRAITVSQKQHADDAEMSGISAKATVEMMTLEEAIPNDSTQLSFATTGPILHNDPFFSQVPQLSVATTNPILHSGSFFSQLLQDFDKNYGDGSSKDFDKNYGDGSSKDFDKNYGAGSSTDFDKNSGNDS